MNIHPSPVLRLSTLPHSTSQFSAVKTAKCLLFVFLGASRTSSVLGFNFFHHVFCCFMKVPSSLCAMHLPYFCSSRLIFHTAKFLQPKYVRPCFYFSYRYLDLKAIKTIVSTFVSDSINRALCASSQGELNNLRSYGTFL